jgi:nucleolar MIF4G domain-containing protein 1
MGMNTDTRRAIFKAIMGSEDYQDAFQRLLKLGLKTQQDREVALILMDCTAQEKSYNPFYAHLAAKLCLFNRRYRFSFQLAFWDVLKDLDDCEVRKLMQLGELLGSLVAQSCLFLAQILRSTALTKLSRRGIIFFKVLFSSLLSQMSGNAMVEALFLRIAEDRENDGLRTGLSFFFQYHMKESLAWLSAQDNEAVQERCLLAEDTLRAPSRHGALAPP